MSGSAPWRLRILPSRGDIARAVLVQSTAALLTGDRVVLRIRIGVEGALELIELGATIAHHVRGGPGARLRVELDLERGARLVWAAQPLIISEGSALERYTSVAMQPKARLLLREAIALGRARQPPGMLRARTRIVLDGAPAIDETLDTSDPAVLHSAVVAGDARFIDSLMMLGVRDLNAERAMQLAQPGTIWRALAPDAGLLEPKRTTLFQRWRELVLGT
jgi:urease accessory protein